MLILYITFSTKQLFININENDPRENTNYGSFLDKVLKAKSLNRVANKYLVEKKRKQPINSQTKWLADCMIKEMSFLTGRLITGYF